MILVTGATGFVGNALCSELAHRRMPFRPVSRLSRGGFHAVGDIDAATDWSDALSGIDTVVHLAARVHVMAETAADPLAAFRAVNVDATLNLARQAASAGVRRFIFLSTVKVNGETTGAGRPFTASDTPRPEDPYGLSKWEAEQALLAFGRTSGMEIVVIRPPLVYGPGVKANFARMMLWLRRGVPLPLGRVANRRSLVFVGNLVDFIILCVRHPAVAGRVLLVSDGADLSTTELLVKLSEKIGRPARLLPVPSSLLSLVATVLGRGSAARRLTGSLQLDIGETLEITGWTPPYSVDEGLRRTAAAFLQEQPQGSVTGSRPNGPAGRDW